jgi:5'-nucleotidase
MYWINRRNFIRKTALVGLGAASLGGGPVLARPAAGRRLVLLHTNDMHSRLDAFPSDGGKYQGKGGLEARASVIQQIRDEGFPVLLVDAGDIFQGTPYFNIFKGAPEIAAMTLMGYDAATPGSSDFSAGLANLATQWKLASFPMLACNYGVTETPLENILFPYHIIERGNLVIGVLGVGMDLKGRVPDGLIKGIEFRDPIKCVNETTSLLKKKGCELVVCLSHLGDYYKDGNISDAILARENLGIDIIIGAQTHRFFQQPLKYVNKGGGDTLVSQMGWGGVQLGRIDYFFPKSGSTKTLKANRVVLDKKKAE